MHHNEFRVEPLDFQTRLLAVPKYLCTINDDNSRLSFLLGNRHSVCIVAYVLGLLCYRDNNNW